MSEYPVIVFTALLILGYGIFSKRAESSIITAPMVFVTVGIIISFFVGEEWREGINATFVEPIAQLTLILVLFIDASTLDLKALMKDRRLPMRLLFIGLPITMVLGVLIAIPLFPEIELWPLILMAVILSPTDAALGLAVVTSELVPLKIRQTINVESGLNDGIAFPPLLICIAVLAGDSTGDSGFSYWGLFILKQFVYGPLIGGAVGWVGGYLVELSSKRGWMNHTFQRLASIAIAILAYSLAEMFHGNGFIAAFFAGMLLGTRTEAIRARIHEFGEAESQALILFIFLLLGMILVPFSFPYWNAEAVIYAVLSLTFIRMVPVAISLLGTGLSWGTIAFIGWFGPRGIASVLYLLMVVIALGRNGYEQIYAVITLTVLLSILLHGISAVPLSKLYQKKK
ncbi:MAG: cation:proton antiporter [Cyclobacteriaceae bacterium]